uniref:Nodule-specific cysteine-rich peptide L52 n=1 Tax=Lens culinaris TaxID=3864 RepID=A0A7T8DVA1_LENCU|nr:nodule-specific cysteine-rich peptide L52 [Lens culinaris]
MAKFVMFVYTLIIFLFLFLIETGRVGSEKTTIPCDNDHDCDEVFNCMRMCIDGFCDYVVLNL